MLLSQVAGIGQRVLHLCTACAEEPMLNAQREVRLLHVGIRVVVKVIH